MIKKLSSFESVQYLDVLLALLGSRQFLWITGNCVVRLGVMNIFISLQAPLDLKTQGHGTIR